MKELITPELAGQWVESYFYEKPLMHSVMRNIRPGHVAFLADEMTAGRFGSATIVFADCKENGRRFIVNGNHTLRAIVNSGVPLFLTVERNDCETMAQVRHLYATYDKNLARARNDSLRAYDATTELNIRSSDVGRLASAVAFIEKGFTRGGAKAARESDRELLEKMRPWAEPCGHLLAITGTGKIWHSKIASRRGVFSVALYTMRYQPARARSFWQSIVIGDVSPYSPALRLRDYLLTVGVMASTSVDKAAHPEAMAKTVAYCWNKYFAGVRIESMRPPLDKPIIIEGTPLGSRGQSSARQPVTTAQLVGA